MASLESILKLETPYEEDERKFFEFMNNNMQILFPIDNTTNYTVPYLYVKSVINATGKSRNTLLEFKDNFNHIQENSQNVSMHKKHILYLIHKDSKGSFIKLINRLKKFNKDFAITDRQYNKVKYGYEKTMLEKGRL